jgi:hypothetical protein
MHFSSSLLQLILGFLVTLSKKVFWVFIAHQTFIG